MTIMLTLVVDLSFPKVVFDHIDLLLNVGVEIFGKNHLWMKVLVDPLSRNVTYAFLLLVC